MENPIKYYVKKKKKKAFGMRIFKKQNRLTDWPERLESSAGQSPEQPRSVLLQPGDGSR